MGIWKEGARHSWHLYGIGAGILLLALVSGGIGTRGTAGGLLRRLCDGFSVSMAFYFLAAFFYRPKGYGLRRAAAFYLRRLRNLPPPEGEGGKIERKWTQEVTNDFLEAVLLFGVSFLATVVCLILNALIR